MADGRAQQDNKRQRRFHQLSASPQPPHTLGCIAKWLISCVAGRPGAREASPAVAIPPCAKPVPTMSHTCKRPKRSWNFHQCSASGIEIRLPGCAGRFVSRCSTDASDVGSGTFLRYGVARVDSDGGLGGPRVRAHTPRNGALLHVANRPIAHHVLDVLSLAGVREMVVASSTGAVRRARDAWRRATPAAARRCASSAGPAPLDLPGPRSSRSDRRRGPVHRARGQRPARRAPRAVSHRRPFRFARRCPHRPSEPGAPEGRLSAATQQMLHIAELDP